MNFNLVIVLFGLFVKQVIF